MLLYDNIRVGRIIGHYLVTKVESFLDEIKYIRTTKAYVATLDDIVWPPSAIAPQKINIIKSSASNLEYRCIVGANFGNKIGSFNV